MLELGVSIEGDHRAVTSRFYRGVDLRVYRPKAAEAPTPWQQRAGDVKLRNGKGEAAAKRAKAWERDIPPAPSVRVFQRKLRYVASPLTRMSRKTPGHPPPRGQ